MLPLAYFLPKVTKIGVYEVRWAIVPETVVGAVTLTLYFRAGI
jgi:Na+-driven multidrug efflux pump